METNEATQRLARLEIRYHELARICRVARWQAITQCDGVGLDAAASDSVNVLEARLEMTALLQEIARVEQELLE